MSTIIGTNGTHSVSNGAGRNGNDVGSSNSDTNGIPHNPTYHRQACPIAIVGMAMRLPGNVNTANAFWDTLVQKKSTQCLVPPSRYSLPGFYASQRRTGTVNMEKGYFLAGTNLQHLDTSFFSMTRAEVELLDPQQKQLLEVTRECFENAGETGWRGKDIGCFIGVFGEDWQDLHSKDVQEGGMYRIAGLGDFVLGNRVSYEYNLKGPRYVYLGFFHPKTSLG
jgi:acyl transferase domain-containing protein